MSDVTNTTLLGSASKLHRSLRCPASVHLPQTRPRSKALEKAGDRGKAIHTFCELAPEGVTKALEAIPATYREYCTKIDVEQLAGRYTPPHRREVAYAHDGDTGEVRELLCQNGARDYGELKPTETPGTADVMLRGFATLEVWDYKTGRTPVPHPSENPQLKHLALAAVQIEAPHADTIVLGIQTLKPDSSIETVSAVVDRWALEEHESEVRVAQRVALKVIDAIKGGETPPINPGPWCQYCDAAPSCPAA